MKKMLTSLQSFFAAQLAVIFVAGLMCMACPVEYNNHDEWNCTPANDDNTCISSVDCNSDKLECRSGHCLDKKLPSHGICASDGFIKPESQGCADGELLCSQYCVAENDINDFAELCCSGGCGEGAECCVTGSAQAPECVSGGCACIDSTCHDQIIPKACCGGACVNLESHNENCGACFHACPAERPICFDSTCVDGRGNECCGSSPCQDCTILAEVCIDGRCQDCTDDAQCGSGQGCSEQLNIDVINNLCTSRSLCKSNATVALGGDCSEQACDDGLLCVRHAQIEDAGTSVTAYTCKQSCTQMTDCPIVPGGGCKQVGSCSGYCE